MKQIIVCVACLCVTCSGLDNIGVEENSGAGAAGDASRKKSGKVEWN